MPILYTFFVFVVAMRCTFRVCSLQDYVIKTVSHYHSHGTNQGFVGKHDHMNCPLHFTDSSLDSGTDPLLPLSLDVMLEQALWIMWMSWERNSKIKSHY